MKLVPIGSILGCNGKSAMVTGYHKEEKENRFVYYYIMCGLPVGFTELESLFLISVDAGFDLIFPGYMNETGNRFLNNLQEQYDIQTRMSVSEWDASMDEIRLILEKINNE